MQSVCKSNKYLIICALALQKSYLIIKQFHRIGLYLLLRILSGEISRLEAGLPELVRRRKPPRSRWRRWE